MKWKKVQKIGAAAQLKVGLELTTFDLRPTLR